MRHFKVLIFIGILILLPNCSTILDNTESLITGGTSKVPHLQSLNTQPILFPSTIHSVTEVPGKKLLIVYTGDSKGVLTQVDETTGNVLSKKPIQLPFYPGQSGMVADSRGNLWIFPQTLTGFHNRVAIVSSRGRIRYRSLPHGISQNASFPVIANHQGNVWFLATMMRRNINWLVLYRITASTLRLSGPFPVGKSLGQSRLAIDRWNRIWVSIELDKVPTIQTVSCRTSTGWNSNTRVTTITDRPGSPGFALLSGNGNLMGRLSAMSWETTQLNHPCSLWRFHHGAREGIVIRIPYFLQRMRMELRF
ncbi:MAG: NHL repeat-containing protein [Leptospirales bacterium]